MGFTRFWLFVVTLAAAIAVALALLAPRPVAHELERESGARLERAQHAAALLLKVNARKWMDSAAQVATDPVLIESLEQATRGPADLALVHKTVQERLRYFSDKMKVDLVIAADAKGRVIARAGLDENVYKDGIEGFPLIADALRGLRGDDTWSLAGKLYRVAATPVIARERYAGALVLGQEVGAEVAQSMRKVLDVDVAFFLRGRVLASSAQPAVLTRLPLALEEHDQEMTAAGRSAAFPIDENGQRTLVVVAPFVGEAAAHKAAYALFLPAMPEPTLGGLLRKLAASDPKTLPWTTLLPVGGALLAAWLLGFLLIRLESDRPIKRLAREAQSLARGDLARLDEEAHPGKLGTIARALNITLDRVGSRARGKVDSARIEPPRIEPPRSEPRMLTPLSALGASFAAAPEAVPEAPLAVSDNESTLARRAPIGAELTPVVDVSPIAAASMAGHADLRPQTDFIEAPVLAPLPPTSIGGPTGIRNFDDEPTVAAQRASSAPGEREHTEPHRKLSAEELALDEELRGVYQDFFETKQRCGESIEGLSYDKFVLKLKSNRTQLISRYSCKSVRFQVYIKDGKAALKATPV